MSSFPFFHPKAKASRGRAPETAAPTDRAAEAYAANHHFGSLEGLSSSGHDSTAAIHFS